MIKKFKSKGKIVNKLTRDGIIEQNVVTGEKVLMSKRAENFNLHSEKELPDIALKKMGRKKKKAMKKFYEKQSRIYQTSQNVEDILNNLINEIPLLTESTIYNTKTDEVETKENTNYKNINETLSKKTETSNNTNIVPEYESHQQIYKNRSPTYKNKEFIDTKEQKIDFVTDIEAETIEVSGKRRITHESKKSMQKGTKYQQRFVDTFDIPKISETVSATKQTTVLKHKTQEDSTLKIKDTPQLKIDNEQQGTVFKEKDSVLKHENKDDSKLNIRDKVEADSKQVSSATKSNKEKTISK